ncbi:ferritin-like domain-containing protein [Aliikangiella maris]|uniref:Ferritin-like domain-containing protein n=2 Tax=Aliikangiella maris TaxID=3162458 RepID=A0ABV3MNT2_9GAMM
MKPLVEQSLKRIKDVTLAQTQGRSIDHLAADLACVQAIAQAAVNVELFTIPLYMTALYSIQGTHQINSKNSQLYTGRWWPGSAPSAGEKLTVNQQVFNKVYSVFVEEMLHLQLAANMSNKLGITPTFTSLALQTENFGWHCYNQGGTTIPHILDFTDWKKQHTPDLSHLTVELRAMNSQQVELFLAIEETQERAEEFLNNPVIEIPGYGTRLKYFEPAPFNWFTASMDESDLPLFGSIGHLYLCYWSYLEIQYNDGTSLLSRLTSVQRDQFNNTPARPCAQYPGIDATLNESIDEDKLKLQLINNIDAITSQGEGQEVAQNIITIWGHNEPGWAKGFLQQKQMAANESNAQDGEVLKKYQPSATALKADYPGYDDNGQPTPISGSAQARIEGAAKDHFALFSEVQALIQHADYLTWDKWHQKHPENPWQSSMLGKDGAPNLPSTQEVADALNRLNTPDKQAQTYQTLSQSAVGTIKGITTQLNRYWQDRMVEFPSPAMGGSGDRVSICWAVTGKVPDLTQGIGTQNSETLYHACQGMALYGNSDNTCADVLTYHSCKGSNECKTQGGCGFVQSASGGGSCSSSAAKGLKSAPADNLCGSLGGCAVPISASQLFPIQDDDEYQMQLYKFAGPPNYKATKIKWQGPEGEKDAMPYKPGDKVYDIAWQAYCMAKGLVKVEENMTKDNEVEFPEPPKPSDIRLAMPPST